MRIILLTILALAGCSSSSGAGSCTEEEGKAPCCNPPAVEDLVCDEGAELKHEVTQVSESWVCVVPGEDGIRGDALSIRQDDGTINHVMGGIVTQCYPNGSVKSVLTELGGAGACFSGCWAEDGSPSDDCYSEWRPACEG